jgi:hypothetical protein
MATQPREHRLEFHVRVLPNGVVSGRVANKLQRDDTVTVHGPFGDACWDAPPSDEPLLLAGGAPALRRCCRCSTPRWPRAIRRAAFTSEGAQFTVRDALRGELVKINVNSNGSVTVKDSASGKSATLRGELKRAVAFAPSRQTQTKTRQSVGVECPHHVDRVTSA